MNNIKRLKPSDIEDLIDNEKIEEQELENYFLQLEGESRNLEPAFTFNPKFVLPEDTKSIYESGGFLNAANAWCKRIRKNKYNRKIRKAKKNGKKIIKVIAEGDSWFQYPFILDDIIDHLDKRDDVAIRCFSDGGDILENMLAQREFASGLKEEQPEYFLISGGGNDLVDGAGLKRFLLPFKPGRVAENYFRNEFQAFQGTIYSQYRSLFSNILAVAPSIKILCHGYSQPVPNDGKWLGKPMNRLGISDKNLQKEIMDLIVDDINDTIKSAAKSFSAVKYLDVRNTVPNDGWHDEFHPTSKCFGKVAQIFSNAIT